MHVLHLMVKHSVNNQHAELFCYVVYYATVAFYQLKKAGETVSKLEKHMQPFHA